MSLRTFTVLVAILLVGHTILAAPGGRKHGNKVGDKPAGKVGAKPAIKGGSKGGGKGGSNSPAVQQTTQNKRQSLPLDILPYHYTVSIVPDLDNSTFFGEVVIDFEAKSATQEIILHSQQLQIDYDKVVLTERRCTPPSLVEASTLAPTPSPTTTSTTVVPSSTAPYEKEPTSPSSTYRPDGVSSTTGTPETVSGEPDQESEKPEESSNVGVEMSSAAPAEEEAPVSAGEEMPPMAGEAPGMTGEASPMEEEAPAPAGEEVPSMAGEAPGMTGEASPMEEAPAPAGEEVPPMAGEAPGMTEEASPMGEEAPATGGEVTPMEEVTPVEEESPAPAIEEAASTMGEEASAQATEEEASPMVEAAPVMEVVSSTGEEAPASATEEKTSLVAEEATAVVEVATDMSAEAPVMEEEASPMAGAPEPAMEEVSPMAEETPVASDGDLSGPEEAPAMAEIPAVEEIPLEAEKNVLGSESAPVRAPVMSEEQNAAEMSDDLKTQDEVPPSPQEAPISQECAPSMSEEVPMSNDEVPVSSAVANEKVEDEVNATSPTALEANVPQQPTTTVKEQVTETTTVKDTFDLAGEALKILELLNRPDIPAIIQTNQTDGVNDINGEPSLTDDGIQTISKIDNFMDRVQTRTDDLVIEESHYDIETIPAPDSSLTDISNYPEHLDQTAQQTVDQTAEETVDHTVDRIIDPTLEQTVHQTPEQTVDQNPEQTVAQTTDPVAHIADQTADQTVEGTAQPTTESVEQVADQTAEQKVEQTAQPTTESVEQVADQTAEQKVEQTAEPTTERVEQSTPSMLDNIRSTLTQLVQTTLAPLMAEESEPTNPTQDEKSDVLHTIDEIFEKENDLDKANVEIISDGNSDIVITADEKHQIEIDTDGKYEIDVTTADGKSNIAITTEGKSDPVETTTGTDKISNEISYEAKLAVESTTDGNAASTTEESYDTQSTTLESETLEMEPRPLEREDPYAAPLPNSQTTYLPEEQPRTTTLVPPESATARDIAHVPTDLENLGTEWTTDSPDSVTTEDIVYTTSEKSTEGTTEYATTTAQAKLSRKRRSPPKRKRRPSNRNKLKQTVKLPQCTNEDMYEVRVDKALAPSKRKTELDNADIGVEIAKDKIRVGNPDYLILPTKTPLKPGKRYRLTMKFTGKMSRRPVGLYRSDYVVEEGGKKKNKYVATTVFEPIHARRVFPCLDDPRFRARFSMRIAHPPNLSAYSNMPASTTSDDVLSTSSSGIPQGWLWDRFETSPPMPTYLVSFFVGALARKSRTAAGAPGQNNLMVRVLARRERLRDASFALNLAPKVMMEMGQWLNKPTSLTKLDLLALPGPGPDAVENWGLVSFQERYLLTQPGLLSRFSVASVLSHELAHDWFGNLVTPHHWRYAWLSEGLATYSSARILHKIQPTWDVEDLSTTSAYITALTSDDDDAIPVQPKKITANNYRAVFSPSSYYKGYMVMRMLHGIIGEDLLTESLRKYVQQNAFGWSKTSRLWAAVNQTAKEKDVSLGLPKSLPKLMSAWLEEPGYPVVTITRNYTTGEVFVQQSRNPPARSEAEQNTTWWIPLRSWTAKTTGAMLQWIPPSSNRKPVRLLSPVPIGGDQWIMGNAEFSGPMRVQYDIKNWDLLAAALPNGDLPRGAGAQLSVDALTLASNGQLPFSVALKVVAAALGSRTGDAHLTWTAASPALKRIDRELRGTKASRPYRQWLHRLISPLDTWISFEARNDTVPDAVLARHVTTAACSLAMPLCLSTSRSQFRSWMASNTPEPRVPIELRNTLYCAAMRDGTSDAVWRFLWSKVPSASSDEKMRILKSLGCTRDPELAKRLLQLAADVKSPVYKKQLPTIVRSMAMHDSGPGVVLSFLAENVQKFSNDSKTLGKLIAEVAPAVNSKKDLKKLQGILPQIITSRATVAKVTAEATSSMQRSQRLSQGINAYFNKTKKP